MSLVNLIENDNLPDSFSSSYWQKMLFENISVCVISDNNYINMNISRPPIPLPSQSRKNNHVEVGSGKVSREKSRKSVKNGVTLARDHSIRFDKQYQEKHLIVKPGIPMSSSKNLNSTKSL